MNPAFECPSNLPLEAMKKQIQKCNHSCLVTDSRFRILAQNEQSAKNIKISDGGLFLPYIFPDDYRKFINMSVGQIFKVKLNCKISPSATVTRFCDYFLFFIEPPMDGFVQSAVRIKSDADRRVVEVEEFYARMSAKTSASEASVSFLRNRQLVRKFNSEHMLEMVSDINLRHRESFDPSTDVNRICQYANETLNSKGVLVYGNALSSVFCCNGVRCDLYVAVSVMIAVAADLSCDGKIRYKGAYSEYKYRLLVDCRTGRNAKPDEDKLNEQLEYLQCIAAGNGWYIRMYKDGDMTSLILLMPCNEERTVVVRAPSLHGTERAVVAFQLSNVNPHHNRKGKK